MKWLSLLIETDGGEHCYPYMYHLPKVWIARDYSNQDGVGEYSENMHFEEIKVYFRRITKSK